MCNPEHIAPFSTLALGTRFKYLDGGSTWVKLSSSGTLAKWEDSEITNGWIGQPICSLNENNDMDEKVRIVC